MYQHPSGDPQAGVSELALNFDYNANQTQWLLLAPGLVNWVTQDTHLGLYRNYFGQDIDDTFITDNEWSSQYQCTPAATDPPDYTCPPGEQGVAPGSGPGVPPDVQMSAADVAYVTNWEQRTGIKLELAFNGIGACTADTAADESNANCTGSYTDGSATYTDPGQSVDTSYPNDAGLVNALLASQSDFNWITHTWSHLFLGCTDWQPQSLTSVTASGSGGTFSAGSYSYEVTAATAYGESEPSSPQSVTVGAGGSVTLTWPEAGNGTGTNGTSGPSLAKEEASHTGGDGFWGYKRLPRGSWLQHLRAGRPGGREPVGDLGHHLLLHRHRQCRRSSAQLGSWLPDRDQPRHRLLERRGQLAAGHQHATRLVDRPGDRPGPGVRRARTALPASPRRPS